MSTFKAGIHEFTPKINFQNARKAEKLTGLSLRGPQDFTNLIMILEDVCKFASLLWALVETQATAAGLTQDQFEDLLDGETIEAARAAVREQFTLFCPSHQRGTVRDLFARWDAALNEASTKMGTAAMSDEFQNRISKAIDDEIAKVFQSFGVSA